VTGLAAVPDGLKALLVSKKIVWGVDYDPEDIEAGPGPGRSGQKGPGRGHEPDRLRQVADKLNDLASKRAFYFGLIKRGWKTEEINAFVGGSLRPLSGNAMMGRMN